jgi:RNA polymerase sigma factor (sigma-70 family)
MRASVRAIEAVYRTRAADFFRFALAKTGDLERARDAVQEGFARAIRGRTTFHGSGLLEAWVARCVINAAQDLNRAASRTQFEAEDVGAEPLAASMATSDEGGSTVREALLGLPQRQRDAVFLRYYLDFDYRVIAEALDVEVGTVSATLHAAHRSLRNTLQEVRP